MSAVDVSRVEQSVPRFIINYLQTMWLLVSENPQVWTLNSEVETQRLTDDYKKSRPLDRDTSHHDNR